MVIDKSSSGTFVHLGVNLSIQFLQQESLQEVEANQEVDNENDAYYQGTERSKGGDRLERNMCDVRLSEGTMIPGVVHC